MLYNDLVRLLRWRDVSEGRNFHAALVRFIGRGGSDLHTHDFAEFMYVVAGTGSHPVNGTQQTICEGDLLLIRPRDCHGIFAAPGETFTFINIAFPAAAWVEFLQTAGLDATADTWENAPMPPLVTVPAAAREQVAGCFYRALRAFAEKPTRLELVGFWVDAARQLIGTHEDSPQDSGPEWLAHACRAMREEHNLREGFPRLLQLSGVSAGHLSRAMVRHRRQTPTDFLNELRLERAALLLSTTPQEIIAICDDCGFGSLSYFYRIFRQRFGETPAQYRSRLRRSIAP